MTSEMPSPPAVPFTTAPIVYTISYQSDEFTDPVCLERYRAAPPDLLHVGKAVPVSHHWGPTRMYKGENQWTGGPGHTLDWGNIAPISPEQLAERIENIRRTVRRFHELGIREVMPYISYHALAGDHEKRLGFWAFYDQWALYAKWLGPKPARDPFDWLVVDRAGQFVGGSCGGYSPDYYAPLHRYRACIRHPDWIAWQRRLVRLVAEVGYDGCFVDNATAPDDCYCGHCKAAFAAWLPENREADWVRRLTSGLDVEALALGAPQTPAELVRRFRLLYLRDYLAGLRDSGREVNPKFLVFPNGNAIEECLVTGAKSDRLMFESSYPPGILSAGEAAAPAPGERICRTHGVAQMFAQHMQARQIFLGYEALRAGMENVQELSLAEMAAFSGGGGFSGSGAPQARYRAFFQRHPTLFAGGQMTASVAVLYSHWGRNPLDYRRSVAQPTIQELLAESHRPHVALVDAHLPAAAAELAAYRAIYLQSPAYEVDAAQLAALQGYAAGGGAIVAADPAITLNGQPIREVLGPARVAIWDGATPHVVEPLASCEGRQANVRFALYRQESRRVLHAVNYNVCLLDPQKRILDVEPMEIRLPVPAGWAGASATVFDPDAEPRAIPCRVADGVALLTLPKLHLYQVVAVEREESERVQAKLTGN